MYTRIQNLILAVVFLIPIISLGQQNAFDSLAKQLKELTPNDTNYINTLSSFGVRYQHRSIDSMLQIANTVLKLSHQIKFRRGIANGNKLKGIAYISLQKKELALYHDSIAIAEYMLLNDYKGIGAVYNNMAVLFNSFSEYNSANIFYQKSIRYRQLANDQKGIGDCHTNMGNNLMSIGDYNGALSHMLEGLSIRKKINDWEGVGNSYSNLGNLYYYMRNFKKSEESYWESYYVKKKIGSQAELPNLYINIGSLHYEKQAYDSANYYFKQALQISKANTNIETIIISLNNLAEIALKRQKYQDAFAYLNEAEKYVNPEIDNESNIVINTRKALCYDGIKNYQQAILYQSNALNIAQKTGAKRLVVETAELLSTFHEKVGNFDKALYYFKLSKQYADSVYNEKNAILFSDLLFKYEAKQKEDEIARLELDQKLQLEKSNHLEKAFALLVVILFATLITLYVIYSNRVKEKRINELVLKQKNTLENHNLFKSKIFTILAHDLRAPVASVLTVLNLRKDGVINNQQFLDAQDDITTQIRNLSFLLDNLLRWAKSQMTGEIKLVKSWVSIHKLVNLNQHLFQDICELKNLTIINRTSSTNEIFCDKDQLDIIIRNLISNALKFSNVGQQIEINEKQSAEKYELTIQDFGIGMDEATMAQLNTPTVSSKRGTKGEQGTGIGLSLCKEFTELNGGVMTIESKPNQGTKVTLTFST